MARATRAGPGAGGRAAWTSIFICDALGVTTRRAGPRARASCMRCMVGAPQREERHTRALTRAKPIGVTTTRFAASLRREGASCDHRPAAGLPPTDSTRTVFPNRAAEM